uniref:Uncharacterized protein n=1 Tax=Rhizophora mucronata TaxID=61149 RepID=A0A2P2QJ50_RHIMU
MWGGINTPAIYLASKPV